MNVRNSLPEKLHNKNGKDLVFSTLYFEKNKRKIPPYTGMKMIVNDEVEKAADMPLFVISFHWRLLDL